MDPPGATLGSGEPDHLPRDLDAFYPAVKSVHSVRRGNHGGTAPYGDPPGGLRMRPALFVRDLLCLHGRAVPHPAQIPPHFDILAHDPYVFSGPARSRILARRRLAPRHVEADPGARGRRSHRPGAAAHPPSGWVTEFGWSSWPPDPGAGPLMKRARWIDQAFYELWRQGIDTVTWYLIVDEAPGPTTPRRGRPASTTGTVIRNRASRPSGSRSSSSARTTATRTCGGLAGRRHRAGPGPNLAGGRRSFASGRTRRGSSIGRSTSSGGPRSGCGRQRHEPRVAGVRRLAHHGRAVRCHIGAPRERARGHVRPARHFGHRPVLRDDPGREL